jgi:hypothetical protein
LKKILLFVFSPVHVQPVIHLLAISVASGGEGVVAVEASVTGRIKEVRGVVKDLCVAGIRAPANNVV